MKKEISQLFTLCNADFLLHRVIALQKSLYNVSMNAIFQKSTNYRKQQRERESEVLHFNVIVEK